MKASRPILIVDDDKAVLASAAALVQALGHEVVALDSAESLLDCNRMNDAGCIVLDHHLPGLSGLDALELLRRRGVAIPVIIVTANGANIIPRAQKLGAAAVLHKPLAADALAAWLDMIFGADAP